MYSPQSTQVVRSKLEAFLRRIERNPSMQRFLSGAFWSVAGSVLTNGASLVMTMILARIVGKGPFGHYVAIQSTVVAATAFSWHGVGYAVTRYAAELNRRDPARLGRILALSEGVVIAIALFITAGLFFGADWLSLHVLHAPDLGPALAAASLATLFSSLDGLQKNTLIGMMEMRTFAVGSILGMLAAFPIMLGLAYLYGVYGAAMALVLAAIVNFAISRFQFHRSLSRFDIRMSFAGSLGESAAFFHFAVPGLLLGLLPSLAQWSVQAMLTKRHGGYDDVAVFGVAMQWFFVVNFLPGTITRVLLPVLTEFVADKDHRNSRYFLLLGTGLNVLVAIPVALFGALLSPYIMASYGPQFVGGYYVLIIAMATAVLHAAQNPVQNLIAAKSQMWLGVAMTVALNVIYVIASYFLVAHGAGGAATALAIAYLLQIFWVFAYVQRALRN